jgi:hypothetical protein
MHIRDFSADTFAGYLAAFLDGEGCIEIQTNDCGVRLRLANTHRATLEGIHERLGYGRVEEYRRQANAGYRPLYCFAVSSAPDVERFLLLTRPYIQIKAEKADRALAIIAAQRERMEALDARNRAVLNRVNGGAMQKDVAREFGISQSLVSRIKSGHLWPTEIAKFNARRGLKKGMRPSDQLFRLHGEPPQPESVDQST